MENIFYVYVLINSLTGRPIYIGKGKNNRMFKHKQLAVINKCENKKLERKILKILSNKGDIICEKIYTNCTSEEALQLEKETISLIGLKNLCNLTEGGAGGDCLTNHPEYNNICKRMGDTRRGRKRTKEEIQSVVKGLNKWRASTQFKEWRQKRAIAQKELGRDNPLYKYITGESSQQREHRMKNALSVPRWNKGLTKETSELLKRESERRRGSIPANATKCTVKNIKTDETFTFLTLKDFKVFLKEKYGYFNGLKLQYLLKGINSTYKDFIILEREKYEHMQYR